MVGIVDCLQYKVLLILWQLSHTKQRTNIYNSTDPKVIYLIGTSSHFLCDPCSDPHPHNFRITLTSGLIYSVDHAYRRAVSVYSS